MVALCCPIVRRANLEVATKRLLYQQVKRQVKIRLRKCVPTAISGSVDISEVPGYHLLWQRSSQ